MIDNPFVLEEPIKAEASSTICTLFEGDYHYGVVALINSLYNQGYRGAIFAGYRGSLPRWTSEAVENDSFLWKGARTLQVAAGMQIHFLPIDTEVHFTNYKPDFMKIVWNTCAPYVESMFYFDPDIVLSAPWTFIKDWLSSGIALCEDVNSPLHENHPRRTAWRKFYQTKGFNLTFKGATYVNGGFIGLTSKDKCFLDVWINLQEAMASIIGSLKFSALMGTQLPVELQGPYSAFSKTDQDALNAAVEVWNGIYSFIGQEGMALKPGAAIMLHALGVPKPWQWNPLLQIIKGYPPRPADRYYWKMANSVIKSHRTSTVIIKKISMILSAFLGRFYHRR